MSTVPLPVPEAPPADPYADVPVVQLGSVSIPKIGLEHAVYEGVTLTVIDNYLTSTCRDMGVTMMKTSYSPIFNESLDFSCVMFNTRGDLIGQGGVAVTDLRPAGLAQFGTERLDVVTEGDYLPHGTPVEVVRSEGYRHVVRAAGDGIPSPKGSSRG